MKRLVSYLFPCIIFNCCWQWGRRARQVLRFLSSTETNENYRLKSTTKPTPEIYLQQVGGCIFKNILVPFRRTYFHWSKLQVKMLGKGHFQQIRHDWEHLMIVWVTRSIEDVLGSIIICCLSVLDLLVKEEALVWYQYVKVRVQIIDVDGIEQHSSIAFPEDSHKSIKSKPTCRLYLMQGSGIRKTLEEERKLLKLYFLMFAEFAMTLVPKTFTLLITLSMTTLEWCLEY